MLTEYETTVVLRPNIGGDTIEAHLDKIRNVVSDGGMLLAITHWGKKRLAYEVKKHNRGVYVHTHYLGAGSMVAEIERNLRLSEDVLRYLTVRLSEAVDPTSRTVVDYQAPEYDAGDESEEQAEADHHGDLNHDHDVDYDNGNPPETDNHSEPAAAAEPEGQPSEATAPAADANDEPSEAKE